MKIGKYYYKLLLYNCVTDELGLLLWQDGIYMLDVGFKTGYKAYTYAWKLVGEV